MYDQSLWLSLSFFILSLCIIRPSSSTMFPTFRFNLNSVSVITAATAATIVLAENVTSTDNTNSTGTSQGIVSMGTAKMIGFLLAICGNTLIACSLTLQKSAHNSLSPDNSPPPNTSISDSYLDEIEDDTTEQLTRPSTSQSMKGLNSDDPQLEHPVNNQIHDDHTDDHIQQQQQQQQRWVNDVHHADLSAPTKLSGISKPKNSISDDIYTEHSIQLQLPPSVASVTVDINHSPRSTYHPTHSHPLRQNNSYQNFNQIQKHQSHHLQQSPPHSNPANSYDRSSINPRPDKNNSMNKNNSSNNFGHLASPPSGTTSNNNDINNAQQIKRPNSAGFAFLRNPTWWMGTFLMAAGEIGNFAAFAFAPASLVAPLGAWSVVLSAILAHVFLHETISNTNIIGIALCVTGAFLIGTSGPDVSGVEAALDANAVSRLLVRIPFVIFMLLTLTATGGLIYISHRTTLGQQYIFVYVGVSSLLGGVTVVCAKALSTFIRVTIEGNSQFGNWLPFALVIILGSAILAQLRYLNMAMSQFGNAQVIPVYYVLFTSCAMTSGVIMYREFDELTAKNLPFFVGICSTMSGVFLVSKSARAVNQHSTCSQHHHHVHHYVHHHHHGGENLTGANRSSGASKRSSKGQGRGQGRYDRLPVSPMSSPRGQQTLLS